MKLKQMSHFFTKPSGVFFIVMTLFFSCQDYNSHSFDKNKFSKSDCSSNMSEKFCAAYLVLQNKCANCHQGEHDDWKEQLYQDEQKWISQGLVVAGSPETSSLYSKLKSQGGDMPPDGELSNLEDLAIFDWISGI